MDNSYSQAGPTFRIWHWPPIRRTAALQCACWRTSAVSANRPGRV